MTADDDRQSRNMDVQHALKYQCHAALQTLRMAIEKCPDPMWARVVGLPPFWRVEYHALFFAEFYGHQDQDDFKPCDKYRDEAQYLAAITH